MSLSSELEALVQLHAAGNLTDAEFEAAKAKLLSPDAPVTKASTALPPVQKSIRAKKNDDNPHPMRVVVSSMLIIVAAVGLIFATMVPYKYDFNTLKGDCSGPIFEMFQRGDYNPSYNPNYKTPSNPGQFEDFWASIYKKRFYDNYCIEPGKPRLFSALAVFVIAALLLWYLWRVEISDAISKHQNKK